MQKKTKKNKLDFLNNELNKNEKNLLEAMGWNQDEYESEIEIEISTESFEEIQKERKLFRENAK
ncbi:MAG: hypothetical protein ACK52J_04885 [bacterium]